MRLHTRFQLARSGQTFRGSIALVLAGALLASGCSSADEESDAPAGPCMSIGGLSADSPRRSAARTTPLDVGGDDAALRVLVLTETQGFAHDSIPTLTAWFEQQTATGEFDATVTADSDGHFSGEALAETDVVVFGNTTLDVLDGDEQDALQAWVEDGGGFVGVHSAADTEHDWEWYGDMLGASFESHPLLFQDVELTVEDPSHPSTAHLDETFRYVDEHYNYDRHPRDTAEVLISLDEATATYSYNGEPVTEEFTHGADHPVAWTKQAGLGRVFYTNLGHHIQTWQDPAFQQHVTEGIRWTASGGRWRDTVVANDLGQAIAMRVAPSGHVLWIERDGLVALWDPADSSLRTVGNVPTEVVGEGGLIGIELAPDVATTGDIYLYFTRPQTVSDTEFENVVVRFTLDEHCTLDANDGEDILVVPNDGPSHQGGDMRFHPDGTLLIATGDNTENLDDGGAPIDPRPGHEVENAFRTSGDPTDLRGAILRITPDGEPADGNLASTGVDAAPEVFITGVRNPYRLAINPDDGSIWWGEIGPDAAGDLERGPRGFDELNRAAEPGDGGWPRCAGDTPYRQFDFDTETVGEPYSCDGTIEPQFFYDYATVSDIDLGNAVSLGLDGAPTIPLGRALMVGPFLTPDDGSYASGASGLLTHEFARSKLLTVTPTTGDTPIDFDQYAPWVTTHSPIDIELGPDGALYVLDYGGFAATAGSGVPRIQRIEYSEDGSYPTISEGRWVETASTVESTGTPDELYQLHCAGCHGATGQGGTGPSFEGIVDRLSADEQRELVAEGRGRMPAFGEQLTDDERDAVIEYIRSELN